MIRLIFLHPAFHMHMLKKYFSSFYRFLMGNKLKDYMILNSIWFDPSLIFISIVWLFQSSILTFFLVCFVCINLLNTGQSHIFTHINCITFLFLFTVTVVHVMFSLVKICDSTCINCVTRFVYSLLYKSLFIYRPGQHRAWSQHSYQNNHDGYSFLFNL